MSLRTRAPQAAHADADRPPRPATRRRRRLPSRLALLLAAPLLVLGLAACDPTPEQDTVRRLVNETRRAHGLNALEDDPSVRLKAQGWADHLAATGSLAHSDLSGGLDHVPWVALAENVGRGASIEQVHQTYLGSSRHRANVLDRRWERIGTGHAVGRDGRVYTVQIFVDIG